MTVDRTRKNTAKGKNQSTRDDDDDLDRRGRPGKFTDEQKKWIRSYDPGYDCKVAPFNKKDEDDTDLKDWVDNMWEMFQLDFAKDLKASPYTLGQWDAVRSFVYTICGLARLTYYVGI